MKILLVDDDAFLRDMYSKKFTSAGDTIDTADTGAAALMKIKQGEEYDAVLLDMVMPGVTGTELLTEILGHYKENPPACIVLSNQGQQEHIETASQAGAAGYIVKAETIPSDVVTLVHDIITK